jgi:hypothetical protein
VEWVDVPAATHGVMGKGKTPAQDRLCLLAGTKVPLEAAALARLYKDSAGYRNRVGPSTHARS